MFIRSNIDALVFKVASSKNISSENQEREVQTDVLISTVIQEVVQDLKTIEQWLYPLFLLRLSTGMRIAEIKGLTRVYIRWDDVVIFLIFQTLKREGFYPDSTSGPSTSQMSNLWCRCPHWSQPP